MTGGYQSILIKKSSEISVYGAEIEFDNAIP
jgi:hypothetical protein